MKISPEGGKEKASSGYPYPARGLFSFFVGEPMNSIELKRRLTAVLQAENVPSSMES
jgi:hypothetical protein